MPGLEVEDRKLDLPSLERQSYSLAVIGGGVGSASVIAQLAKFYKAFSCGEKIEVGGHATNVSFRDVPVPPSLSITVFEPHSVIGAGWAFRDLEVQFEANTPVINNGLHFNGDNEFELFGWSPQARGVPPTRNRQGDFSAWQLKRAVEGMAEKNLPFFLHHIAEAVRDVSVTEVDSLGKYQIDFGHGPSGSFDGLLVATGHSPNNEFQHSADSEQFIENFYLDYQRFQRIIGKGCESLIIAGMGDTSREVIGRLKLENFKGKLTVVATGINAVEVSSIIDGMGGLFRTPTGRYLNELNDQGRLCHIDGRVVSQKDIDGQGIVTVQKSQGELTEINGALILGAPFKDGVSDDGESRNAIVRMLQANGFIGSLRLDGQYFTNEFGIAPSGRFDNVPPVFMAGRVALKVPRNTINLTVRHAEEVAWSVLQHAIFTAWQSVTS